MGPRARFESGRWLKIRITGRSAADAGVAAGSSRGVSGSGLLLAESECSTSRAAAASAGDRAIVEPEVAGSPAPP